MNLELLDPFEQDFPEVIEDTLEDGPAVRVKFNRRGTLLAAGCTDGTIVVWDFDTRGVSRSLIGHVKTITSLSWSRNGRYLLSSSMDWSCIVWDLLTGSKKHTIRFDTPVLNAQFHPKNNSVFIAALFQEEPVFVDFSNGVQQSPILKEASVGVTGKGTDTATTTSTAQSRWTMVATFDKYGKKIYTGSNRGYINIIDTETRTMLYEIRPTLSAIKNIQFSRRGKEMVVNANDRIIRLFATRDDGPPEQQHKFQDLVNKIHWNQCCLSSDSDYVIGGSAHQAEHNIFIWDRIGGNLVKILEGPKEPLEDLTWHPIRPIVASVSSYGTIHIWATNYQENWSAFAPDFKELEENIDYEEREDEFDIVPEEEASKRRHDDEDVIIDVTTIEKANPYNDSDSEDDEEETFYLPLLPSDQQDEELLHTKHHHRHSRRHTTTNRHSSQHGGRDRHDSHHHMHSKQDSASNNNNNNSTTSHHHNRDGGADSVADSYKDGNHHQRRRDHKDRDHGSHGSDKISSSSSSSKPKKRSDEYSDHQDGGRDYENGHLSLGGGHGHNSGNGYERDQQSLQQQHSRRKLEDSQSHSRSIKRQR
ncbi:hypothetical protein EC957_006507 [Mortierella hygrophila]|uniref:Uncharacterized protein n=1 Tax=Mortierella hygrophila TaxID=979708 RepID=A0A9P6FI55_9FUNG|nr:hypothetical protein EC957_006507 [Mortierella hygrophila]